MKNKTKFKIAEWYKKHKQLLYAILDDLAIIVGFLCLCFGAALVYKPLFWMFLGLGLMKLGAISND